MVVVADLVASHDLGIMRGDPTVIILVLTATIVPWFLWMFATAHSGSHKVDTVSGPPEAGPFQAGQAQPDDSSGSHTLTQLRPDGVILDWRDEPR